MKLSQLTEVRYAGSLEAEEVLYTLWKERNKIQKDNLSVVKIDDPVLSKKRAAAVARYAVRVIASEALDAVGRTDEAQKLRELPPDVVLTRARDVARIAAGRAAARAYAAAAASADAASSADVVDTAVDAADYAADAAYYANAAALYASKVTNKQRHLYHLNQMIKIAANIK